MFLVLFSSLAVAQITSTATGGLWSATTTWAGGVVPAAAQNVTIVTGATVDVQANITQTGSVTVNSGATFTSTTTATQVTVGSLVVNSGGIVTMNRPFTVTGTSNISGTINFGSSTATARAMTELYPKNWTGILGGKYVTFHQRRSSNEENPSNA